MIKSNISAIIVPPIEMLLEVFEGHTIEIRSAPIVHVRQLVNLKTTIIFLITTPLVWGIFDITITNSMYAQQTQPHFITISFLSLQFTATFWIQLKNARY